MKRTKGYVRAQNASIIYLMIDTLVRVNIKKQWEKIGGMFA